MEAGPKPFIHWGLALAVLLGLVSLSELGLALGHRLLWQRLDRLELVDHALLEDHRDSLGQGGAAPAMILGDSVLYGSALREQGRPRWRRESLGAALQGRFAARGITSVELSGDGLYPSDLEALSAFYGLPSKGPIVVELNVRMFAAAAGDARSSFSHRFLAPEETWNAAERVSQASHLFRYCRLASHLLWQPSRTQVLGDLFSRFLPAPAVTEADQDLGSALLNMKIQPYYAAPVMAASHSGLQALDRLGSTLQHHARPVLVFLTPQNQARIADVMDLRTDRANRKLVADLFKRRGIHYEDWAQRPLEKGAFLDHCHLDAAGNQELAAWVMKALAP